MSQATASCLTSLWQSWHRKALGLGLVFYAAQSLSVQLCVCPDAVKPSQTQGPSVPKDEKEFWFFTFLFKKLWFIL